MPRSSARWASSAAPTSNSTGPTKATEISTAFSPPSPRASARRSARSARRRVERGIEIEWLTGSDVTEAAWDAFFAFYMDTGSRKWGRPYLNRRFFSLLGERMADRVLLIMAKRERPLHRRRAEPDRLRHALRPLLGRGRGASLPALRGLLLPGDRLRAGAQAQARRGRRAGRAQARARLHADDDAFGALHRRPGFSPRRRELSRKRAARGGVSGRGCWPSTRRSGMWTHATERR